MTRRDRLKKPGQQSQVFNRKNKISFYDNYQLLHNVALWGLSAFLLFPPFYRGLFFAEDQQKAFIFAVGVFWLTILWKWLSGDQNFFGRRMDYLVISLPVVYLLSAFGAANYGFAVDEIVKALLYFMIYCSAASLVQNEKEARRLFMVICLAGVAVSLVGLGAITYIINITDGFRMGSKKSYPKKQKTERSCICPF